MELTVPCALQCPLPPAQYEKLDKMTTRLIEGILAAGKEAGHAVCGAHPRVRVRVRVRVNLLGGQGGGPRRVRWAHKL